MQVHLIDGTYELFRYHYSPNNRDPDLGAVRGVVNSMLQLVQDGATHVGIERRRDQDLHAGGRAAVRRSSDGRCGRRAR